MNRYNYIVVALFLVFLLAFLWFFSNPEVVFLFEKEKPIDVFSNKLSSASCVNIVEVMSYENRDIMQCGVDYALDLGALGKTVNVFSFYEGNCYSKNGVNLPFVCVLELFLSSCPTLYLVDEGEPNSYENILKVVVPKGYVYNKGDCSIKVDGTSAYERLVNKTVNKTRKPNESSEKTSNESVSYPNDNNTNNDNSSIQDIENSNYSNESG